jgi:quinol monooxygenase YgiN
MGQQHVGAFRVDDPRRTGDVPVPAIAFEAVRLAVYECFEAIDRCGLVGIAAAITRKQVEHTFAVHRIIMPCSQFSLEGITMLAIIAKLKVVPGKEAEFEKVMLGLAKEVRANEPGNKMYTLTKSEAGEYLMLELYDSEASLTSHGQTAHFKAAGPKFAGLMAGRPDIQRLEVIG